MPPKTRSGSMSVNEKPELFLEPDNMAASNNKPNPNELSDASDVEEPDTSKDDHTLLKEIIKNQKTSDKKIGKRFSKLDTTVTPRNFLTRTLPTIMQRSTLSRMMSKLPLPILKLLKMICKPSKEI